MTLHLPPDLESALVTEATRHGATPEVLALVCLRERFAPPLTEASDSIEPTNLAESLAGHLGVLSSGAYVPGGAQMSRDCGAKLADDLVEKRREGWL